MMPCSDLNVPDCTIRKQYTGLFTWPVVFLWGFEVVVSGPVVTVSSVVASTVVSSLVMAVVVAMPAGASVRGVHEGASVP